MDISLIIPTFNRNNLLFKHLEVIHKELSGMQYEVIVINDSKTNAIKIPIEWTDTISVYHNPKQGVASARNYGASLAQSEKLVFIDDDMIITRQSVEKTIEYLDHNKDVCLNLDWVYPVELQEKLHNYSFGRYLNHFGFSTYEGWIATSKEYKANEIVKVTDITSQFLAMSKDTFRKAGGYNEDFPFAGFEDYDFKIRLLQNGITPYLDTNVLIWHNEEDRVQLDNWLKRKHRGGKTRYVAVQIGHKDLELNYNNLKGKLYYVISKTERVFIFILNAIPNLKIFDPLYFRLVNILLGTNLYKGYTNK